VRLLLDTNIFLWVVGRSPRLSDRGKEYLKSANAIYVSSATIWEIAIKVRLGKLHADPDALINMIEASGFEEFPVLARHAVGVARMPLHHGDPFDRLLVAQAFTESMHLLTADEKLLEYSDLVIHV